MAYTIAVAGKGGTGKTTLTGLLIDYLCKHGKGPILAVDADANSNLNEVLGVEVETTLGDIREDISNAELAAQNPIPAGMTKAEYLEFMLNRAKVEEAIGHAMDAAVLMMQGEVDKAMNDYNSKNK